MLRRSSFKRPRYEPPAPPPVMRLVRPCAPAQIKQDASPQPKENPLVCEEYRRLVRQLPCARCGIEGYTQFCHADEGKGMGLKTDDRRGWPGCGPHGEDPGCHWYVGTSGRMTRDERRAFEEEQGALTRAKIEALGLWPKKLPRWSIG